MPARDRLTGVAALQPDDARAVGWTWHPPAVAEHWDGEQWTAAKVRGYWPKVSASLEGPRLDGRGLPISWIAVVSTSPADAWAVGSTYDTAQHGVVGHWDGTSWTLSWSDPTS